MWQGHGAAGEGEGGRVLAASSLHEKLKACCYAQAAVTYRRTHKAHLLHLLHLLHSTAERPLCWIPTRGAILHFQFTAINEFDKFFRKSATEVYLKPLTLFNFHMIMIACQMFTALQLSCALIGGQGAKSLNELDEVRVLDNLFNLQVQATPFS